MPLIEVILPSDLESLLVEDMEWENEIAFGETAFWLKVLSIPKEKELQLQKLQFKRDVFEKWSLNENIHQVGSIDIVSMPTALPSVVSCVL